MIAVCPLATEEGRHISIVISNCFQALRLLFLGTIVTATQLDLLKHNVVQIRFILVERCPYAKDLANVVSSFDGQCRMDVSKFKAAMRSAFSMALNSLCILMLTP